MTDVEIITLDSGSCEPTCCCPCTVDFDVLVLGSTYRGSNGTVGATNADCNGTYATRDVNGHYAHGATVYITAATTLTIPAVGGCSSIVADFDHWEISCDGAEPYEDDDRDTSIIMGEEGDCDCMAVAVYVPRETPIVVQCLSLTICRIRDCEADATQMKIVSGDDTTITPRGVPLACGYGYLKPCQGGPSSVTVCFATNPMMCLCSAECPPSTPAAGTLCRIDVHYVGSGCSLPSDSCADGPCATLTLSYYNTCAGGSITATPEYVFEGNGNGEHDTCADCGGEDWTCP